MTGYNNQLKQATQGMKLGINNDVNKSTKKAGLHLMAGGPTKINPPNSHPSNPIHKAATKTATKTDPKPAAAPATQTFSAQTKESAPTEQTEEPTPTAGSGSESHDVNKNSCRCWRGCSRGSVVLVIPLTPLFDTGLHQKGHISQNQ